MFYFFSEKFEKIHEKDTTMSVEVTSPRSESGSSSSRSDWFRKSVLFWSSQSERSDSDSRMSNKRFTPTHEVENNKHKEEEEEDCLTEESESEKEEDQTKSPINPKRNILDDFDPSDLLRQVEELEKCFTKSRTDLSSVIAEENSSNNSGIGSPHLTLEFPNGSNIRENPLFKNDLLLRKTGRQDESDSDSTPVPTPNPQPDNHGDNARTPVDDQHIIESIQKVNDTLFEISREIESSRLSSHAEDDKINLENRDSTTPSQDIERGIEIKRYKPVTLDSTRSDETVIVSGRSDGESQQTDRSDVCFVDNTKYQTSENNDTIQHQKSDKENFYTENDEYQSSLIDERDCSSACTESTIDDNKSESSDRADPNDVMRDWLSNIKPPPSPANIKLVVNKERCAANTEDVPPSLPRKTKSRERRNRPRPIMVPELPLSDYSSTAEIPRIVSSATSASGGEISRCNSTASHDDLFEKIDQLICFERRDSENTICLPTTSGRSSSSSGAGGGNGKTVSSNRDRLDSGLQSVSSDSGSSPYPSPNVTRAPISSRHQHHVTSQQQHTIREESYNNQIINDHVFRDNNDSDFSEWSPVSTLASNRSVSITPQQPQKQRPRSQSVTVSSSKNGSVRRRQLRTSNSTGHMSVNGIAPRRVYDTQNDTSHEMATIEKFLKLTNTYLNNKDGVDDVDESTISLENVSALF